MPVDFEKLTEETQNLAVRALDGRELSENFGFLTGAASGSEIRRMEKFIPISIKAHEGLIRNWDGFYLPPFSISGLENPPDLNELENLLKELEWRLPGNLVRLDRGGILKWLHLKRWEGEVSNRVQRGHYFPFTYYHPVDSFSRPNFSDFVRDEMKVSKSVLKMIRQDVAPDLDNNSYDGAGDVLTDAFEWLFERLGQLHSRQDLTATVLFSWHPMDFMALGNMGESGSCYRFGGEYGKAKYALSTIARSFVAKIWRKEEERVSLGSKPDARAFGCFSASMDQFSVTNLYNMYWSQATPLFEKTAELFFNSESVKTHIDFEPFYDACCVNDLDKSTGGPLWFNRDNNHSDPQKERVFSVKETVFSLDELDCLWQDLRSCAYCGTEETQESMETCQNCSSTFCSRCSQTRVDNQAWSRRYGAYAPRCSSCYEYSWRNCHTCGEHYVDSFALECNHCGRRYYTCGDCQIEAINRARDVEIYLEEEQENGSEFMCSECLTAAEQLSEEGEDG